MSILLFELPAILVRRSARRLPLYGALLGAVLAAVPAAAPVSAMAATASQSQIFGTHPVHQGQTTLPGGHFNYALAPGEAAADGVVIENFSDRALDFHVYGADLLKASGGGFAPAQATDPVREAGAWIAVATPTVTIPAHGQFIDNFSLTLPSSVSPGEHRGAVVVAAIVGQSAQGANIEARVALITDITVPGAVNPSASLGLLRRSPAGQPGVGFSIELSNTGNVLLTYDGVVDIFDSAGNKVATLPLTPADAYVVPGGQIALSALWKGSLPQSGNYTAKARIDTMANGAKVNTLTSQSLDVSFDGPPTPAVTIGLALLVLILLAELGLVLRRRRRRKIRAVRKLAEVL